MKITPKIEDKRRTVDYADLKDGECFLYNLDLYIKEDFDGFQYGICLTDGEAYVSEMCGTQVVPVNCEIKWSYKGQKKKR